MKYWSSWYRSVLAGIALLAGLGLHSTVAFGQAATPQYLVGGTFTVGGTSQVSANTDVNNLATLNYTISGTAQPAVPSNTATFKVDNLVNLTVNEVGGAQTVVAPGALAQVTTFNVTNNGNAIQDYLLTAANMAGGTSVTLGSAFVDTFDAVSCTAFVETNGTAGYQPGPGAGTDTDLAIVSLAPGASKTVYIVCNIPPAPGLTAGVALVSLTAQTYNATTCTASTGACVLAGLTAQNTASADNPSAVDVVFADGAATSPAVPGDAVRDGKRAAVDAYQIANAIITVAKSVSTLCDPLNFAGNGTTIFPKAIPGAYVKYSIVINNTGAATASATLATITDSLNANLTFDPNLITGAVGSCDATTPESLAGRGFKLTCAGTTGRACTTAQFFTTANADDAIGILGANITANLATALPVVGTCTAGVNPSTVGNYCAGELKPGETVTIFFNVIVK